MLCRTCCGRGRCVPLFIPHLSIPKTDLQSCLCWWWSAGFEHVCILLMTPHTLAHYLTLDKSGHSSRLSDVIHRDGEKYMRTTRPQVSDAVVLGILCYTFLSSPSPFVLSDITSDFLTGFTIANVVCLHLYEVCLTFDSMIMVTFVHLFLQLDTLVMYVSPLCMYCWTDCFFARLGYITPSIPYSLLE